MKHAQTKNELLHLKMKIAASIRQIVGDNTEGVDTESLVDQIIESLKSVYGFPLTDGPYNIYIPLGTGLVKIKIRTTTRETQPAA